MNVQQQKSRKNPRHGAEDAGEVRITALLESPEALGRTQTAEQEAQVAVAAYFRAEKRGFEPGHELEDWLAAEAECADTRSSGRSFEQSKASGSVP
jgi:hypothetical protein